MTTELQVEPVESERRDIPRQHRKKPMLQLYLRRLKGRTDTDTFFLQSNQSVDTVCADFLPRIV